MKRKKANRGLFYAKRRGDRIIHVQKNGANQNNGESPEGDEIKDIKLNTLVDFALNAKSIAKYNQIGGTNRVKVHLTWIDSLVGLAEDARAENIINRKEAK